MSLSQAYVHNKFEQISKKKTDISIEECVKGLSRHFSKEKNPVGQKTGKGAQSH